MGQKTCPSCGGFGDFPATERVPNPGGGMFQEVSVRKSCGYCGGMGTVWEQDPIPSYSSGGQASSSRTRSKSPGLLDQLVSLGMWWVGKLWPLRICAKWGQQLMTVSWKIKVPLAVVGAVVGVGLFEQHLGPMDIGVQRALVELGGESAGLLALGLGALGGWLLPSLLGAIMTLSINLIALGIGLVVTVVGLAIVYSLIAMFAGWPSLDQFLPHQLKDAVTEIIKPFKATN